MVSDSTMTHKRKRAAAEHTEHDTQAVEPDSLSTPLVSLEVYILNLFFLILIQDDDELALESYNKNWSRNIKETGNGEVFNFRTWLDFVVKSRKTLTNRKLISQSCLVHPADELGRTGEVGHISRFSAVQDGKEVEANGISVLKIGWKDGRRTIEAETFVLTIK